MSSPWQQQEAQQANVQPSEAGREHLRALGDILQQQRQQQHQFLQPLQQPAAAAVQPPEARPLRAFANIPQLQQQQPQIWSSIQRLMELRQGQQPATNHHFSPRTPVGSEEPAQQPLQQQQQQEEAEQPEDEQQHHQELLLQPPSPEQLAVPTLLPLAASPPPQAHSSLQDQQPHGYLLGLGHRGSQRRSFEERELLLDGVLQQYAPLQHRAEEQQQAPSWADGTHTPDGHGDPWQLLLLEQQQQGDQQWADQHEDVIAHCQQQQRLLEEQWWRDQQEAASLSWQPLAEQPVVTPGPAQYRTVLTWLQQQPPQAWLQPPQAAIRDQHSSIGSSPAPQQPAELPDSDVARRAQQPFCMRPQQYSKAIPSTVHGMMQQSALGLQEHSMLAASRQQLQQVLAEAQLLQGGQAAMQQQLLELLIFIAAAGLQQKPQEGPAATLQPQQQQQQQQGAQGLFQGSTVAAALQQLQQGQVTMQRPSVELHELISTVLSGQQELQESNATMQALLHELLQQQRHLEGRQDDVRSTARNIEGVALKLHSCATMQVKLAEQGAAFAAQCRQEQGGTLRALDRKVDLLDGRLSSINASLHAKLDVIAAKLDSQHQCLDRSDAQVEGLRAGMASAITRVITLDNKLGGFGVELSTAEAGVLREVSQIRQLLEALQQQHTELRALLEGPKPSRFFTRGI